MKVELVDQMGDDLDVVNAARVSFDKESNYVYLPPSGEELPLEVAPDFLDDDEIGLCIKDRQLISYLAKHKHWSPFSHCFVKFRIKAPIFVARQLQKHVVGLAWNEVSRRYVDSEPEMFIPVLRQRAENVKQGSKDAFPVNLDKCESIVMQAHDLALTAYKMLLREGVCPEQARMVLPQSMYTEWIWSGSLYAFARVCKQRLDSHAQAETRWVAQQLADHLADLFPVSWKALLNG